MMHNQLKSMNTKVAKGRAYQQELKESGEFDYRMELVKQMQAGEITHAEAMDKLRKFQKKRR